jgi:hypothetical protein
MIAILCISIISATTMGFLVKFVDGKEELATEEMDGAARRELRGQRGFKRQAE